MNNFESSLTGLSSWFNEHQRILPWRENATPYRVWISEIMLQQTQVQTVIPYFERFIERYPDVETLASDTIDNVMIYWAGLGYYSRARNLHKTAQIVSRLGWFPSEREKLLLLPGIGPYTAGAVLSIAFNRPEPILDGNVERVLSRVMRVKRYQKSKYKRNLWRLSRIFVLKGHLMNIRPSVLNQAMMELGATVCVPGRPLCHSCPLQSICRAYAKDETTIYPQKEEKKKMIKINETVQCVIDNENKVLLKKAAAGEWREGLWDFPAELPFSNNSGITSIGESVTQHVVTNHKIHRKTLIWRLSGNAHIKDDEKYFCWIPIETLTQKSFTSKNRPKEETSIAGGAALMKSAAKVLNFIKSL